MYRYWLDEFSERKILEALRWIRAAGKKIIFMGAGWDTDSIGHRIATAQKDGFCDLSGRTSFDEMMGLMRYSKGVIGWPAGNTIMASVMKVPTVLIWNSYFCEEFWRYSCPPDSLDNWYQPLDSRRASGKEAGDRLLGMIR
jgi:ADP-heptose:LPS heptosyltransferase